MNTNSVYKINCTECEASCVGKTQQQLTQRLYYHKRDVRLNNKKSIPTHCHENHMDWDNEKILDRESTYKKRMISEMFHIYLQKQSLNRIEDTYNLQNVYKHLFNTLK